MARGAGAALHGKPHRLVEHQDVIVFVERDGFEEFAGLLIRFVTRRTGFRLVEPQRRNAHRLPGLQPVLRLGALAIDAQLAFTDDALDVGEAQSRKPRFQKAVDAHAGFVWGDGGVLHAGRHRSRRIFPFPVILRCALTARLEGCGPSAARNRIFRFRTVGVVKSAMADLSAVAASEIGFARFRFSELQAGFGRLLARGARASG